MTFKSIFSCRFLLIWVLFLLFQEAFGALYYADPTEGSMANDGSAGKPWSSMEAVFKGNKVFKSGDTLFLRSGRHGSVLIKGSNAGLVTIRPEPGHKPVLKGLTLSEAAHWRIQNLTISSEKADKSDHANLLYIKAGANDNIVEDCFLYSVLDNSPWTKEDWVARACNGVDISGNKNIVKRNHMLNIRFGITCSGQSNTVDSNLVENFSGDGIRGLGNFNIFQYNLVKNCYKVDNNHDDGFQSWSLGPDKSVGTGIVKGIILRGNTIINYTNEHQKLLGPLQGIGCFAGFFEDWVIENNVIITDHWHGISLYGARNCRIVNNTVVDINSPKPGPPWIMVRSHKNGQPSSGNLVRNNLTTALKLDENMGQADHNVLVEDYNRVFADYQAFDVRLKNGSPAIGAGSMEMAPERDINGSSRLKDNKIDAGAWEFTPINQKLVFRVPPPTNTGRHGILFSVVGFEQTFNPTSSGNLHDYEMILNLQGKVLRVIKQVGQSNLKTEFDKYSQGAYVYIPLSDL